MSVLCNMCKLKESICICQCSKLSMCDDCFGQHSSDLTEFIHFPILLLQKSGKNLNFYIVSIFEAITKMYRAKEEILNDLVNKTTKIIHNSASLVEEKSIQQKVMSDF